MSISKRLVVLSIILVCFISSKSLSARVTGECVNCHTMHNSQDNSPNTYDLSATSNSALTRGTCLGCHGQDGGNNIINIGSSSIPQVLHNSITDLAGGNFGYLTGSKPITSGNTSTVGHNVIDIGVSETNLTSPPGDEHSTEITNTNFTCSGTYGCHGDRNISGSYDAIAGTHHGGISGSCDGSDIYNSYRSLLGVIGYENMENSGVDYRWQNVNSQYHNEYFGSASPGNSSKDYPVNNTMSGFCAECHGNFHGTNELGGTSTSPFTRHPTDIILPDKTEYASYTTYNIEAPVARALLPTSINTDTVNNIVIPGTDIIMCLSCHGAHATANEDILRWDYNSLIAGGGSNNSGCFICHTNKDNI